MDVRPRLSALAATAAIAVATGGSTAAAADPPQTEKPTSHSSEAALSRIIDRPHTVAELEVGAIALPTAPISQKQQTGNIIGHGDVTVQTGLHILYRWNRGFAVGAGAIFAPEPSSNLDYGPPSLPRTHSRSYLFLGGEGRYIPLHTGFFEAWVGLSAGGIIVADRFTTNAGDKVPEILGTKEVTIRTEGFALGVQGGANYFLSESWVAGATLRAYRWILPETPRCSSFGDCASLSGTVEAFELGVTIGYRLPL
jgi:hypothetical protein